MLSRYQHHLGQINASRRERLCVAQAAAAASSARCHRGSRMSFSSNSRWDKLLDSLRSAASGAGEGASRASERATDGLKSAASRATDDARHLATKTAVDARRAIEGGARDAREKLRSGIIDKGESTRAVAHGSVGRMRDSIRSASNSVLVRAREGISERMPHIPSVASLVSRAWDAISRRMPSMPAMSHVKQRTIETSKVAIRWLWWWGLAAVGVYGICTTATKEGMRMLGEMAATPAAPPSSPSSPEERSNRDETTDAGTSGSSSSDGGWRSRVSRRGGSTADECR